MPKTVRVGIIGGGLMGRETASTFARWNALVDMPVRPELVAVADVNSVALDWFRKEPTVKLLTTRYQELLQSSDVDVVYIAVPHDLHQQIYCDALCEGKDLLAEKPFGIDLSAAKEIKQAGNADEARGPEESAFVRCSSEFPFFPGALRAFEYVQSGACGRILDAVSGFHHSSDLDPNKKANWKRLEKTCGEIGVMGDLGMHACHLPLRLGWRPTRLFAQLSKGFSTRPDGQGGVAKCDTWDNAVLNTWVEPETQEPFPLRLEMKRLAPGETNTWFFEVYGTTGGVRFTTKRPKTLELFIRNSDTGEQFWKRTDLGFKSAFPVITGGIFEVGFADVIQQMWASFLMDREGKLDGRFGCATMSEAIESHRIFAAALRSQKSQTVEEIV